MLKKLLKKACIIISLITVTLTVNIFAAAYDMPESNLAGSNSISFDDILEGSTNVTRTGNLFAGTYRSSKMETGLASYMFDYTIDWEAGLGNDGDYHFTNESNLTVTTYLDHTIYGLLYSYANYDITTLTASFQNNNKDLKIDIGFDFEFITKQSPIIFKDSKLHTFILNYDRVK